MGLKSSEDSWLQDFVLKLFGMYSNDVGFKEELAPQERL